MATTITKNTFEATYKDDYQDSDGYYRILFNSGKKLQARELTQMQTILQKQIERFGNNIFKEGTPVQTGARSIDNRYEFIRLDTTNTTLPADLNTLNGVTYTGNTSQVQFKILQVKDAEGLDPVTLYVEYLSTKNSPSAVAGNTTDVRVTAGETLYGSGGNPGLQVESSANPTGLASRFVISQSIYYLKGFFVFVEGQQLLLSKYGNVPTATVGFRIDEQIFTVSDDDGLYDNQGSIPNITAPGADRFKISLVLIDKANISATDNFIHVADIRDGVIVGKVNVTDSYNIPNQLINQRIRENSGDYVVKPFKVMWEDDSDTDYLRLHVQEGIAVVNGARAQVGANTLFRVEKPKDTISFTDDLLSSTFGNYVVVPSANIKGMPNLSQYDSQTMMNDSNFAGSAIGKCKVRYIDNNGADFNYHLFDIQMNAGQDFRDVVSIGTSTTNYFGPLLTAGKLERYGKTDNDALFQLPQIRPSSVSGLDTTVQRFYNETNITTGSVQLNCAGNEAFTEQDDWIITDSTGVLSPTITLNAPDNDQATISGLPAGGLHDFNIAAYVRKTNVSPRIKTLTTRLVDGFVESNGQGTKWIDLHRPDIYAIDAIYETGDSANEFTSFFTLDNGQRDNYYAKGRAILKTGLTVPTQGEPGNSGLRVMYQYFRHSGSGHYFSKNSYTNILYKDIPNYTLAGGATINLRNFMDFRPAQDSDGLYVDANTGAYTFELPSPNGLLEADISYYQPRTDRLVVNDRGAITYIEGNVGATAPPPEVPASSLSLFTFALNANTFNKNDLSKQRQIHRRFTMKDISALEKRVGRLENLTSLTMLENKTEQYAVLDANNIERTKSGFVTDNLSSTYLRDPASQAAIDFKAARIYPNEILRNIRLIYDSDNTSNQNVIRKGDYLFPTYNEELYIDQSVISRTYSLNEYNVKSYTGTMEISPSSDDWFDVHELPWNIKDLGTSIVYDNVSWANKWKWNWKGVDLDELTVGSQTKKQETGYTNYWLTIASEEEVVEYTGEDKWLYSTTIEHMRPALIYFRATGMMPNARHFAFFNGIEVSEWCSDSDYKNYSEYDSDFGDRFSNLTQHPYGAASTISSDEFGTITGSFLLPRTASVKFPTGNGKFELLSRSSYSPEDAISYAHHTYASTGTLRHMEPQYSTTRVLSVSGQTKTTVPPGYYVSDGGDVNTGKGVTISKTNYNANIGDNGGWSNDHSNGQADADAAGGMTGDNNNSPF